MNIMNLWLSTKCEVYDVIVRNGFRIFCQEQRSWKGKQYHQRESTSIKYPKNDNLMSIWIRPGLIYKKLLDILMKMTDHNVCPLNVNRRVAAKQR